MNTENKKNMEELLQGDIDLGGFDGSDPFGDMNNGTDPFADMQGVSDSFQEIEDTDNHFENAVTEPVAPSKADEPKITETKKSEKMDDGNASTSNEQEKPNKNDEQDNSNPFETEIDRVETDKAEETKTGLLNKAPVFEFAGVSEEIDDLSKTFEDIRISKAEDFPELEDGKRVSWKMSYCGIVKNIEQPKKTTIAEQKKIIEESKDFMNAIKRKKGNLVCKVIPTVTAQKKGRMESYKGIFIDEDTAAKSGKAIAYVPSEDGNVYEIRNNTIGTFRAKAERIRGLTNIKAGFTPALPLFPYEMLTEIIAFFKYFADRKNVCEALVNVYWDTECENYIVKVPEQKVGAVAVETILSDDEDNLIHVMDIHSHNLMDAYFSSTDNSDEKATRIYAVIGRLDKLFPDISMRISVGGKFVDINPTDVFEYPFKDFPDEWLSYVTEYKVKEHKNGGVINEIQ